MDRVCALSSTEYQCPGHNQEAEALTKYPGSAKVVALTPRRL